MARDKVLRSQTDQVMGGWLQSSLYWIAIAIGAYIFLKVSIIFIRRRRKAQQLRREVEELERGRQHEESLRRIAEEDARRVEEDRRRSLETQKRLKERWEKAKQEARGQEISKSNLFGNSGESLDDAAVRLGVEIRYKGPEGWLGRRGDAVFSIYVTTGGPAGSRISFYELRADDSVELNIERFFGLDFEKLWGGLSRRRVGEQFSGWELVERGTEDVDYQHQKYDGDFAHYIEVVDPIGRILHLNDHWFAHWSGWKW